MQLVHTTGTMAEYRLKWELNMYARFRRRFNRALYALLPEEQGRYAIFGRYAYNSYTVPRETQDVDVVLVFPAFEDFVKRVQAAVGPGYDFKHISGQTFVHFGKEKVADLVVAEMNPVLLAALKNPKGTRKVHVPRLGEAWTLAPEAFIASKFYSASEADRGVRRMADAADMWEILHSKEVQPLDRDLMRRFVGFVPWVRARDTFEDILARADAGKQARWPFGPDVDEP